MKNKILEGLTAKFQGVNNSILVRIAEKLAKTVTTEDQIESAISGVTFQQVVDSEADRRATEATQTAVSNYEKKHGLKDGKSANGGGQAQPTGNEPKPSEGGKEGPVKGGDDLAAQIATAIKAAVSPLQQEIATLRQGKIADTRKQQLDSILANSSDKFRNRIAKHYERMNFKDDDDFDSWIDEIKEEAEEDASEAAADGAVFGRPFTGKSSQKDEVPKHLEEYFEGKGKEEGQAF